MPSTVSSYNYTDVVDINEAYGVEINEMVNRHSSVEASLVHSFLRLLTVADESVCSAALSASSINCDDDAGNKDLLTTIIVVLSAFSVFLIFFLVYCIVFRRANGFTSHDEKSENLFFKRRNEQ